MNESIAQKVVGCLNESTAMPEEAISAATILADLAGWGSLTAVRAAMAIESNTGITVPLPIVLQAEKVQEIIDFVEQEIPHSLRDA